MSEPSHGVGMTLTRLMNGMPPSVVAHRRLAPLAGFEHALEVRDGYVVEVVPLRAFGGGVMGA